MLRRRDCRAGFSLVEVLVALFIVAAGLIALLTLFPLGAVQMGQALRDDRSQQCALQADGKLREWWRRNVVEVPPTPNDPYFSVEPAYTALNYFDDLNGGLLAPVGSLPPLGGINRVSYPVLLDPIGVQSYPGLKQTRVANYTPPAAPPLFGAFLRKTRTFPLLPPLTVFTQSVIHCTMPDDMEFAADGTPADRDGNGVNVSGGNIFRAGRYNWAAVLQRPDNTQRLICDVKILVFDRRAPGVNPTAPDNEIEVSGTSNSQPLNSNLVLNGDTQVTLNASNDILGLRNGSWIMDGTINATTGIRNANFYRVTSVDADTNPAQTTVELHVPLVRPRGEANPNAAYIAQFYLFRELIDVYDRPQLVPTGYAKQTP
ncbi:MAG: prepilin-type N-terminal cleavage/methylation domain-containing protein [Fimbriiglobus sp.]|nr:prepilin-type N-terminal cleavage/methylation domain-containing protein [Fimbriiglobus sp.]